MHLRLDLDPTSYFFSLSTWISLSKWPMLQTIALCFICFMCFSVMMSTLPVVVTNMSPISTASSIVLTL